MTEVKVMNLKTGMIAYVYHGVSPRRAVICAYAQNRGDYNTWTYDKYEDIVEEGKRAVACGDFVTLKEKGI